MSDTYTVKSIRSTNEWQPDQGEAVVYYYLDLEGPNGQVQAAIGRRKSKPAPTEGEQIRGTIALDKRGNPKLTPERANNFGGGGRSDSPEQRASIEKQVAGKITADLLALALDGERKSSDQLIATFNKVYDAVIAKVQS